MYKLSVNWTIDGKNERFCRYCGIDIDIPHLDILWEIHGICWQEYRKNGEIYQVPGEI